ncbi:hypothetical protein [Niveispirillum sp. BGYR6]|uniref:hypothetical protein n=1 Tax=Niveispirillum sp. BGYR6 TaxID=2971249 RepID=UPI0022B9D2E9|nr:hypothetical protein [Niveispirillum sp. BGYR6]MDG5496391.1 hypothetical protein [Niveispirillum sp. BGYR6]
MLLIVLAAFPERSVALQVLINPAVTDGALQISDIRQKAAIWPSGQRTLTYWIDAQELCGRQWTPTKTCMRETIVASSLAAAAKDWENACAECGVSFTRVYEKSKATFRVRYIGSILLSSGEKKAPAYIARSFFPTSESKNRILRISPAYFSENVEKIGIIRHELGHILGYVHENICNGTANQLPPGLASVLINQKDEKSLMVQPCELSNFSGSLSLSPLDVEGHRKIYSPASSSSN